MARSLRHWASFLVLALLAAPACTSGDGDTATPTATASAEPTATASPTASATPTPSPTATPEPTRPPDPPRTVWLVDAETGEVLTLHQDSSQVNARFDDAGSHVELRSAEGWLAFALDGSPAPAPEPLECLPDGEDAVVAGMTLEDARCGAISPDGRWMLFAVLLNDNGDWDQWVLDPETGERRLLEQGLVSCGGCDGRFGPGYSPGEDCVYFAETVGNGRTFISDLRSAETEQLGEGGTEFNRRPMWAPTGTRLLYSDDGQRVLLRDFADGSPVEIASLTWPARFDVTGTAIYSPPWSVPDEAASSTTVVDAATFEVLASVDGAAGISALWYPRVVVARSGDAAIVAVERAASCEGGTTIYTPASPDGRCFDSAVGAVVSPDGQLVAFSVLSGETATHRAPSDYEVVIVDTTTLDEIATIEGALSYDAPPVLKWNAAGTHLLVTWPWALGL